MTRTTAVLALVTALAACKGDATPSTTTARGSAAPAVIAKDPWLNANDKPAIPMTDDVARLAAIAKDGPTSRDYPQADSVVALERDDITLTADGTLIEKHHAIVKILDAQRGKGKFADIHVPFDRKRQTLAIEIARTVNADGEAHATSPDEIGDIVPPGLADATMYSDVRERVISFTAVDTGSVVELVWTRTTKATADSAQGGEAMLAQWNPVQSRIVSITTPIGITPNIAVVGTTQTPVETTTATTRTRTITLDELPDAHPEPGQPDDAALLPRVVYGFKKDWSAVLEPVADRFLTAAVPVSLPASIVAQAHALVADAKTETEKAQAIFKFVSRDIRDIPLELGAAGYEPHAPDVVLANRYGDQRDKVGLLLALCAAEKITGRAIMARSGEVPVIESVPTLAQFDRILAKLTVDGKDVWLGASDEYGEYGVAFSGENNLVLPVVRGGAELGKRPALAATTSISKVTASYTLSAAGDLDAKLRYELTGVFANNARRQLRPLTGDALAKFFQSTAAGLSAGAIDKAHTVGDTHAVAGPLTIDHQVAVPGYAQSQGTFRVFEIPPPSLGVASEIPTHGLSTRKYPLHVGTGRTHVADVSVTAPAGWKVAYAPTALKGAAEGVRFEETCTTAGQTVTCHSELVFDKTSLAIDKYAAFRELMARLGAYERRVVLLTKT